MSIRITAAAFAVLAVVTTSAGAATAPTDSRGELLYTTYCVGCHTTQVHWRDRRQAKNWDTLKAEVVRWQKTAGLALDPADIDALAAYLNGLYYHFPEGATRSSGAAAALRAAARGAGHAGMP
jgi:mono/diheme cytochrome c family protein